MIPASELRIGNYVGAATDENDKTIPCRVASVLRESIYWDYEAKYKTPSPDNHTLCEFVDGIPLTPEILEKCGFKKIESPQLFGWYSNVFGSLKLCWCHGDDVTLDDKEGDEIVSFPCKHLHQLQNLYFALTGKELTVTDRKS